MREPSKSKKRVVASIFIFCAAGDPPQANSQKWFEPRPASNSSIDVHNIDQDSDKDKTSPQAVQNSNVHPYSHKLNIQGYGASYNASVNSKSVLFVKYDPNKTTYTIPISGISWLSAFATTSGQRVNTASQGLPSSMGILLGIKLTF